MLGRAARDDGHSHGDADGDGNDDGGDDLSTATTATTATAATTTRRPLDRGDLSLSELLSTGTTPGSLTATGPPAATAPTAAAAAASRRESHRAGLAGQVDVHGEATLEVTLDRCDPTKFSILVFLSSVETFFGSHF